MSRDTESVMSSAVSLSGVESLSDDGSTVSVGGDKAGMAGGFENALFDLGDGDLNITVMGLIIGYSITHTNHHFTRSMT